MASARPATLAHRYLPPQDPALRTQPEIRLCPELWLKYQQISASMLTRMEKSDMLTELKAITREEVAAVRTDQTALKQRVDDLEVDRLQNTQRQEATDLATTRQGNIFLDLHRQIEDLDNHGWRNNIRIRVIPEAEGEVPQKILMGLFTHLLGDAAPSDFGIERAHGALRAPRRDGLPSDIICALVSFQLKKSLMRAARDQQQITYMDAQVYLFQDLSMITLDACRALRPLTRLLQERRIPYKWGFPFSLQAWVGNMWHVIRWQNDVPRFLRSAGLPAIPVPNWILEGPPARATGPTEVAHNLQPDPRPQRHRGGTEAQRSKKHTKCAEAAPRTFPDLHLFRY
ncbi:Hypothetical predicted protein [Pelobates cultripes]|uniref:Uncharacterized protein n=1 Tax=Pelobates cultripes TaxID=61616 RepID=A0AAD1T0S1_PELCU|nr:Hypothetical predicted protein [Pelobates cultripes]